MKKTITVLFLIISNIGFALTAPSFVNIRNKPGVYASEYPAYSLSQLLAVSTGTLVIDRDVSIPASTTVPSNNSLVFVTPFKLSGSGKLTMNGFIDAPPTFIFDCPVDKSINKQEALPEWFGAGYASGLVASSSITNINEWPIWGTTTTVSYWPGISTSTTHPFDVGSTWDTIGIQRAIWASMRVRLQPREYLVSAPIYFLYDDKCDFVGSGIYKTTIAPYSLTSFRQNICGWIFGTRTLMYFYRVGGIPCLVSDLCMSGPSGYSRLSGADQLVLITGSNINQVNFENLWLTAANHGLYIDFSSNDFEITNVKTEYCYDSSVEMHDSNNFTVQGCDFWKSDNAYTDELGIYTVNCTEQLISNCRFQGFTGMSANSISASSYATVNGCVFHDGTATFGERSSITGNTFEIPSSCYAIIIGSYTSFVGNVVTSVSQSGALNLSGPVTGANVVGNVISYHPVSVASDSWAIYSLLPGSSYNGGSAKSIITNNILIGTAPAAINIATGSNVISNNQSSLP